MRIWGLGLLHAACQSYVAEQGAWINQLRQWEEPFSIHAAYIAAHLVDLARQERLIEFSAVFDIVERLLVDGDGEVSEMTTVGLIESIQNLASHADLDTACFTRHLGPRGVAAWEQVKLSWDVFVREQHRA